MNGGVCGDIDLVNSKKTRKNVGVTNLTVFYDICKFLAA